MALMEPILAHELQNPYVSFGMWNTEEVDKIILDF
jgi:hypothetical protein